MSTLDKVLAIKANGLSFFDIEYINFLERVLKSDSAPKDTAKKLIDDWYAELA